MTRQTAVPQSTCPESEAVVAPLTGAEARGLIHTTQWLWPNWIPRGHITVVTGEGGIGKGWFALALAQSAAQGSPWPDGAEATDPNGPVFWFEPEAYLGPLLDRAERTGLPLDQLVIMPDLTRTYYLDRPGDLADMRAAVESAAPSLVVVDSWSRALEAPRNQPGARAALAGLQTLARSVDAAIVLLHHLPKRRVTSETGMFDFDCLRGSEALAQIAAVLIGIDHPDYVPDLCRVTCGKTTFTTPPRSIAFQITDSGPAFTDDTGQRPLTRLEETMEFLESYLKAGPRPVSDVTRHAKLEGIAEHTLRTARRLMCDYCRKWNAGETQYVWSLKRRVDREADNTPTSPGRRLNDVLHGSKEREMAFILGLDEE